ncbi:MAG: TIGR01777 family oxidoreductase [Bacteroidota bacterium]
MATVLITGGTGMIGKALTTALLQKNYQVIILSRNIARNQSVSAATSAVMNSPSYAQWDIKKQTIDKEAIEKADYIIHLAGAGVADKRWTKKRKQEIVESRVKSGELLVKALKETPDNVKAIITVSGIGWYGPDPVIPNPDPFTEDDPVSNDFLGQTCKQWEASLDPVVQMGKRLVKLRTGIVLNKGGGALKEFERPLTFGVATILGSGKQIISWIHIDDLARLFIRAIENDKMSGVYNAVSPHPVSNKELILKIAAVKKGKFFIPLHIPSFVLKLVLGEMSTEILKSATVSCKKAGDAGFTFIHPSIDASLHDLAE